MSNKPNIVFILTDDQGYGDLGCGGNPIVKTPNIDAFSEESVRLTNFHVGPTCAPTRSGLMTGHYANSTGVWHTVGGRSLLRKDEWTIATALNENGYKTGIFGKWHLGDAYPYRPIDRGFETAIVHGGGGISQTPDYWGNDYFDDTYFVNGQPKKFHGYCTDVFFDEALKYIDDNKDQPFFCYIATNAPHGPFNVEDTYADHYRGQVNEQRARFYGMIENIDDNVGKLRSHLKKLNLEDNTILVFMTDNGTSCGISHKGDGIVTDGFNNGLRGMKSSQYDGGHRVPFFIRWPQGQLNHNADVNNLTANIDFMPTLLDLCGINTKTNVSFHGTSLKPLLKDPNASWDDRTITTDSQRLVEPIKWRKCATMTDRWRLIDGEELYDINEDRGQVNNIASAHPEVVKQLRDEYDQWWDLVSTKFDQPIPLSINASPTVITSHDLINGGADTAWNQRLIREGHVCNGIYEIDVEEDGTYLFELRRWPASENRPICQGIDGDDHIWSKEFIHESAWNLYTGGKALSINRASLKIQGQKVTKVVEKEDIHVPIEVTLEKGITTLEAKFINGRNDDVISPYYIDIRKV